MVGRGGFAVGFRGIFPTVTMGSAAHRPKRIDPHRAARSRISHGVDLLTRNGSGRGKFDFLDSVRQRSTELYQGQIALRVLVLDPCGNAFPAEGTPDRWVAL